MLAALYSIQSTQLEKQIRSVWITLPNGFVAWITIGLIAGWLAGKIARGRGFGCFTDIVLGIVGAALANWILGLLGIGLGGWIGYLIAGFIGACIIIALWRAIRGRQAI